MVNNNGDAVSGGGVGGGNKQMNMGRGDTVERVFVNGCLWVL